MLNLDGFSGFPYDTRKVGPDAGYDAVLSKSISFSLVPPMLLSIAVLPSGVSNLFRNPVL
jgi:hypothetical protein